MARYQPGFPELFDRIGKFLVSFNKLKNRKSTLKAAEFSAEFDKLVKAHSQSQADEASEAWNQIVDTVYPDRLSRSCPSGSTRMRG